MTTLTIKNLPPELYERLKERSRAHRRSINSEAIWCLERVLQSERVDPEAFLERTRALRKRLDGLYLTDRTLGEAKELGRP